VGLEMETELAKGLREIEEETIDLFRNVTAEMRWNTKSRLRTSITK
jgi:hypothetical protein